MQLQWNGDVLKAIDLINQAIKLDERCEFGYETLGTIEVQRLIFFLTLIILKFSSINKNISLY